MLVCSSCSCQITPETNGVIVIEMASFGPYKVWGADLLKCRGCGTEVLLMAKEPIRSDHFASDFKMWLEDVIKTARKVFYNYERPRPYRVYYNPTPRGTPEFRQDAESFLDSAETENAAFEIALKKFKDDGVKTWVVLKDEVLKRWVPR